MDINWRDDVLVICWLGPKGIEFDLNPKVYPIMLRNGEHAQLGAALREFGQAILAGKVESEYKPRIYDGHGRLVS